MDKVDDPDFGQPSPGIEPVSPEHVWPPAPSDVTRRNEPNSQFSIMPAIYLGLIIGVGMAVVGELVIAVVRNSTGIYSNRM
jgi:hypothetical protein